MNRVSRVALATAIALALSCPASAAPVPNALRFSVFVSQSGQPFTGSVDIELQFFDAPSGGAPTVAPLVIENVAVQGGVGVFVGDFGASNPLRDEDTWIGGGIRAASSTGAFQTFTTRGRFFPGGFALHAQKIAPGIVGVDEIRPGEVQRRIGNGCALAEAIRQVNQDGSVVCEPVNGSGAGNITAVAAGSGLAGGGSSGSVTLSIAPLGVLTSMLADAAVSGAKLADASVDSAHLVDASVGSAALADASVVAAKLGPGSVGGAAIDASQVQRRIGTGCAVGAAVREIAADGTVSCETIPNGAGSVWQLGGNAIGAGQFLGTSNAMPLELRAAGERTLRLEALDDPDGNAYGGAIRTVNVVAGASTNQASSPGAAVGGGGNAQLGNTAGGRYSTVPGGLANSASGEYSVAMGRTSLAGGDYSLAAGRRATIRTALQSGSSGGDAGSFAWADAQDAALVSSGANQFLVRAQGGVWLGTTSAAAIGAGQFLATSTGAHLTSGGTWTNASSRALKEGFAAIDPIVILDTLAAMPIHTWRYRDSVEGRHLGPVAEDFKAAFDLGGDGRSIATVDADGVALAAIQGLNLKLEAERDALRREMQALRAELERLRAEASDASRQVPR